MFKIDIEHGEIEYIYSWGKEKLFSIDKCKVITYDEEHNEVVMMLESTHESLRPDLTTLYNEAVYQTDIVIVTMSLSGRL